MRMRTGRRRISYFTIKHTTTILFYNFPNSLTSYRNMDLVTVLVLTRIHNKISSKTISIPIYEFPFQVLFFPISLCDRNLFYLCLQTVRRIDYESYKSK